MSDRAHRRRVAFWLCTSLIVAIGVGFGLLVSWHGGVLGALCCYFLIDGARDIWSDAHEISDDQFKETLRNV